MVKHKSMPSETDLNFIAKNNILPLYGLKNSSIEQIKIKNTDKHRAVFKVSSQNKNYCLKKVYYSESDLLFVYSTMEWLFRNGIKLPRLLPSLNNNRYIKNNDFLFILTPWIEGDKCDFDNLQNIYSSSITLATLHNAAKNFKPIEGSNIKEGYENLYISISTHFLKILQCYNSAIKRKDSFSKIFLDQFPLNFNLAKHSSYIASTINFDKLSKSLCHGDYVNKNILIINNEVWIIDFDNCCFKYSINDLCYFLRRLLRRNYTAWDFEVAKNCIEKYNSIRPINKDDAKYLLSYLSFPQKYWRLSKDYYNNVKKCNKDSFIDLLIKYTEMSQEHSFFISKLQNYLIKNFNI
ncbi:CotS family spore coat protein [Clostridium tarantellae]|uniref:CotS family spore coat protein n=1 Tax=Clostridium tarantellae TaxID=39493 RepID=A0A6I1MMT1_9CLOT|nr:CotS family spore coat protein [Clostridium tarantellae]MPQ42231.1 CotS family spore coat protein [Clostridium tarantellae]